MINIIKYQPDSVVIDIGTFLIDKGIYITASPELEIIFLVKNDYYDSDDSAVLTKYYSDTISVIDDSTVQITFECEDFDNGKIDRCMPYQYYYGLGFKGLSADCAYYEPKFVDGDGIPNNKLIVHRNYVNEG